MLLKCNEKKDFDYAIKGIKLYQHKGQDFSAEVAAHFIKVALKLEKTKTAAKILADNSIRLGAWAPPKTTLALVQDLVLKNDVETAVKLFKSLTVRGVPQPIDGYKTVLSALQDNGTAENFDIVMESASKAFKEEDYAVLKSSYKRPSAETAGDSEQ